MNEKLDRFVSIDRPKSTGMPVELLRDLNRIIYVALLEAKDSHCIDLYCPICSWQSKGTDDVTHLSRKGRYYAIAQCPWCEIWYGRDETEQDDYDDGYVPK